jgi:uncharacterized membrane protein YraQ (UPF0718 family)
MEKLIKEMILYVITSLIHNWLPLTSAIVAASFMTVYIKPEKIKQILLKRSNLSIPATVTFGALTPFCACGTMAIIIGMLTTALPWGPIMAFLTSSPLMSPDGFILIAGIINIKFATALLTASIIIGMGSGYLTHLIEKTGYLNDQIRFAGKTEESPNVVKKTDFKDGIETAECSCSGSINFQAEVKNNFEVISHPACCVGLYGSVSDVLGSSEKRFYLEFNLLSAADNIYHKINDYLKAVTNWLKEIRWRAIGSAIINIGVKQILFYYTTFAAIGFLINYFVPTAIIMKLFNAENFFAVPIAALTGLPIYVNGESAIPLIKTFMASGASGGAMLSFLITGPGTSAGVITGIASIMKKRAIFLYVLFLLAGGISMGYIYNLLLSIGI